MINFLNSNVRECMSILTRFSNRKSIFIKINLKQKGKNWPVVDSVYKSSRSIYLTYLVTFRPISNIDLRHI